MHGARSGPRRLGRWTATALLVAAVAACGGDGGTLQLDGTVPSNHDVALWGVDLFEAPDALLSTLHARGGKKLDGWPEHWLDDECDPWQPFLRAGKDVLNAEYAASRSAASGVASGVCPASASMGLRTVVFSARPRRIVGGPLPVR